MKDFVKYNLALKLKEKGFNEPCIWFYNSGKILTWFNEPWLAENFNLIEQQQDGILAPTIHQVLTWLFDKKQLFISLDCNECDHFGLFFTIYKKDEETWFNCGFNDDYYNTPEEAAIGAIEYILDNLI